MIELLFGVLVQGLKLANTKESRKYLDEVLKLKQEWQDEYNKPRFKAGLKPKECRSNAELDAIELRLSLIAKSFIDTSGK